MADNMNAAAAGPPPSGTRPPTRAMTRSMSASTVGLDAGGGASAQVESDLVTRQDMMNLITNLSNEIAKIANQGASQAATNPPLSSASSAASRIARKEADRILLNRMPSTADHYDKWRIKAIANMVSASVNPDGAKSFLNMVDGDLIENLDEVPEEHSTFDAKVKAALLSVIETETEFGGRLLAKYQDKPDMSGRSLLRLIDEDFGRRSKDLLAQRASQLVNLKCATYKDLGKFMSQWHTYSGFIAGSSQDISDDTKKVLLREKLKKIEEVKAVLAQNLVNRGTYRELVDALEELEIMDRVWNHEKERIPVGAAAILQDDFVPCSFCVSLGKDNVTHSKEKCWFNPQSPAYKNIRKEPAPRYHGGYKSTRAQSKFKKNDGRNTKMVLSSESKKGLAAKVAQDMELLRLVAQEMASKEESSEQQDKPKAALALMVKAHHRPTIDSGASHSIRGNGDELGEVTATKMLEIPMQLDCVGGNMEVGTTVNVKNHLLGDIEALNVVNSPPIVSLGQLVKNGYSFMWNPELYQKPSLVNPCGVPIPLEVENNTPVLAGGAKPKKNSFVHHHGVVHMPADPDCLVCQASKLKRRPARRIHESKRNIASTPWYRVSIDLVEATTEDVHGNQYIFTLRDDFSGFAFVREQKTKEARDCLASFQEAMKITGEYPHIVRSDQGGEFMRELDDELRKNFVQREFGLPHRPTTDSRHERFHHTLNQGIRALLFQSGLPISFWSYAAKYFVEVYDHFQSDADFPRNPCEKRTNQACGCHSKHSKMFGQWPLFGASAVYLDQSPTTKYDARAKAGVVIGVTQLGLLVLDVAAYTKNKEVKVLETRDVKVDSEVFPCRQLGFRPESDLLLYKILAPDSVAGQNLILCNWCYKPKTKERIRCEKCKNPDVNRTHRRDRLCALGRCKCMSRPNDVFMEENDLFAWNEQSFMENSDMMDPAVMNEPNDYVRDIIDVEQHQFDAPDESRMKDVQPNTDTLAELPMPAVDGFEDIMQYHDESDEHSPRVTTHDSSMNTEETYVMTSNVRPTMLLTKVVPVQEYNMTNEGKQAIQAEVDAMIANGVWDFNDVKPKQEVAYAVPNARFVKVKIILGIKNWELDSINHKLKARMVAQGCVVKDCDGHVLRDEEFAYDCPVSLQGFRFMVWNSSLPNNDAVFADIPGAYLHAPLLGDPTFLELPREVWGRGWDRISSPVVQAKKAIYGLARSGSDYAHYARKQLVSLGWEQAEVERNLYLKAGGLVLSLYVDDVGMSGPKELVKREFSKVKSIFGIKEEKWLSETQNGAPLRHLGMNLVRKLTHIKISSEEYETHIIQEYKRLAQMPVLRSAQVPGVIGFEPNDLVEVGSLAKQAAMLVGQLLWLARTTRPDIAHAVVAMSRLVTKWTKHADKMMDKVIRYLDSNHGLSWCVSLEKADMLQRDFELVLYCDADYSGSVDAPRSTSGWALFICDKSSKCKDLIDWGSKRQSSTAVSTAEAELIALSTGLLKSAILFESMMERGSAKEPAEVKVFVDNSAAVQAVNNGYSIAMRHLNKVHRVRLGLLHDLFKETNRRIAHVPSAENPADLFTKPMNVERFAQCRQMLVLH